MLNTQNLTVPAKPLRFNDLSSLRPKLRTFCEPVINSNYGMERICAGNIAYSILRAIALPNKALVGKAEIDIPVKNGGLFTGGDGQIVAGLKREGFAEIGKEFSHFCSDPVAGFPSNRAKQSDVSLNRHDDNLLS